MALSPRRRWNRAANAGLALALAMGLAPVAMRAYGSFTQAAARSRFTPPVPPARSPVKPGPLVSAPPHRGWETSVLQIPAIGVDSVVDEGNVDWRLMPGPGHDPRSPGAGSRGNCVIAAHRNMWGATFADLPRLEAGDAVTLTTSHGIFTYRVVGSKEVSVHDRGLLASSPAASLTLYTCVLPFNEARRWVVRARLVDAWVETRPA
jgi:LPXTG-site transpeptidase (sortase) family protein